MNANVATVLPQGVSSLSLIVLALALAYAGLAALCLAMDRHHAQLLQREPTALSRRLLRLAGWPLLLLAAWPCVALWGASIGAVVWAGMLSVAGLLLVLLQGCRPRIAAWTAFALLAMAGGALAV